MTRESVAWSWRHAFASSDLPATTKHVLHTVGMFMNELGEGCYPSVADICRYSGLDKKTVLKHLASAREAGWLAVSQHGYRGQKWKRNEYAARWPQRDLVAPCPPDGDGEGGGAAPPPSATEKVGESTPQGGGAEGSKVVEEVHQDKTSPETTPITSPAERERASEREDENPTEDRRAVEKAFERAWQAWPTSVSDSRPEALKAWTALSPDEREAAAREAERWVAAAKAVGRKHVCSHARYLCDRRWEQLPEPQAEAPRQAEAKPFGKAFMAMRMKLLCAGREAGAMIPALTGFERQLVAAETAAEADLVRRKVAMHGFPKVNRLHELAANGKSILVAAEVEALGQGFEPVRVGGERWDAWQAEHERRGWPWLPDTGRQEWVYFPAGGPEGLGEFEAALRAGEQEAVSAAGANRDAGNNQHEHGGGREAAE